MNVAERRGSVHYRRLLRVRGIVEREQTHLHGVDGQTKAGVGLGQAGTDGSHVVCHDTLVTIIIMTRRGEVLGRVDGGFRTLLFRCPLLLVAALGLPAKGERRTALRKTFGAIVGSTTDTAGGKRWRGRWHKCRQSLG